MTKWYFIQALERRLFLCLVKSRNKTRHHGDCNVRPHLQKSPARNQSSRREWVPVMTFHVQQGAHGMAMILAGGGTRADCDDESCCCELGCC